MRKKKHDALNWSETSGNKIGGMKIEKLKKKKKWHEKGGIGHTHAFNELHYANMHNIDVEQKEGGRNEK